ncbi:MAG: hypothetical protein IKI29_03235 [Clostridia bacterium]|nr:hypothetical protein [Clostridia bacterium]
MKRVLSMIIALALVLSVACSVFGTVSAEDVSTETPVEAFGELLKAWNSVADKNVPTDGAWVPEYATANAPEWQKMKRFSSDIYKGFSGAGQFSSQPAINLDEGTTDEPSRFVILLANQWGDGNWWDMVGISYTVPADGTYLLSCPLIKAGTETAFLNGNEGRIRLTKNGEKIWPTDKDTAVVNQYVAPAFADMQLELKSGDILRFEGYGQKVNAVNKENTDWENHIALNPTIAKVVDNNNNNTVDNSGNGTDLSPTPDQTTVPDATPDSAGTPASASKVEEVINANASLKAAHAANNKKLNAWRAMYLDANCENGPKDMMITDTMFSMKSIDSAMPFINPYDTGVILNANMWADGVGGYWDKAVLAYVPSESQTIKLRGSAANKKISNLVAADEKDPTQILTSLTVSEARVAIFIGEKKIWPTDKDYVIINANTSIDFPELELNLKKGDKLYIMSYGAMPGQEITGNMNSEWRNHVLMDPEVVVLSHGGNGGATSNKTGATFPLFAVLGCVVVSAGALIVLGKKRLEAIR